MAKIRKWLIAFGLVLRHLLDIKRAGLQRTIVLRRDDGFASARQMVLSNEGKRAMDAMRLVVAKMNDYEQARLVVRTHEAVTRSRSATVTTVASLLSGLMLLGKIVFTTRRAFATQQRAAEALSAERDQLRTTLSSIGDAVIVTDAAGRVTLMNAEAHTLTGWGEDALGRSLGEVFRTVNAEIHPVEATPSRTRGQGPERHFDQLLREGSVSGIAHQTVLIARDGTEVTVNERGGPIRDADGEVTGVIVVFRDARKERRADEAERSYARLLQFSPDAIFSWRLGTGVETWNRSAEQLYGFSAEEVRGRNSHELLQTEAPLSWAEIETVMRNHERWDGELVQRTKDGRKVTVAARLQLTRDADGVERVLESNSDITERKYAEEELRKANAALIEGDRSKNQFLATLAHELRNPLAPIQNSLYILDRAAPGDEKARHARMVIGRQVAHMTRIVEDLLDVARISRGLIRLQRESMDLAEVVRSAVEDLRVSFQTNDIDLQLVVPGEQVRINGDPTRVAQVVGNFLGNAAKFTPHGGSVTVIVEADQRLRQAIVRVRDTGLGIAPEVLQRLYEPFTQADKTLDRSKGGIGLGLTLVKAIMELHGGTASAKSEGIGKGAEFAVCFPLETGPPLAAATPTPGARQNAFGRRVVIIEDNVDAAETLREVLEFDEHTVEVAVSGQEGIDKARVFKPEIVFCDIGLPGMDGYDVARAFRADPVQKSVTLVALTGYASAEDVAKSKQAGFDRLLAKPPNMETIAQILASPGSVKEGVSPEVVRSSERRHG